MSGGERARLRQEKMNISVHKSLERAGTEGAKERACERKRASGRAECKNETDIYIWSRD